MVGTRIIATPDATRAKLVHGNNTVGVALFHHGSPTLPGLGAHLKEQVRHLLPAPPTTLAWDFLSIALAIFAADRFVLRSDAEDGWTRVMAVDVAVQNPAAWIPQAVPLASALRFLTGDLWTISFSAGGDPTPNFQPKLQDRDTICLFSGGLDSLLGALKLLEEGRHPLLVSQGSPKEIKPQKYLAEMIGLEAHRFEGRVSELWQPPYEPSTRGRSIIFFAYGVIAASALKLTEVIVPENGFIAINPPLTPRRLGSLSTRTTHPHLLSQLEAVIQGAGIPVRLTNIFEGQSKGKMLAGCNHPKISMLAAASYSCGKGKRMNGQCGRCVPCLIRRASFKAAAIADPPSRYATDLRGSSKYDDVMSARIAVARRAGQSAAEFERWIAKAGPLPSDPMRRAAILKGVSDGMAELNDFLSGISWKP